MQTAISLPRVNPRRKASPSFPSAPIPWARNAGDLFVHFFRQLDERGVPYVVLHGYENFPEHFPGDVDYAIAQSSWPQVSAIYRELSTWGSWRRVQSLKHETTASYDVFMHRRIPGRHLKLDYCSHYVRNGALLLQDRELLERRRRHNGFAVPAADVEFAYVLAKALAKGKDMEDVVSALKRLQSEDGLLCRNRADELVDKDGANQLDAYLAGERTLDLSSLRRRLLKRHKVGLQLRLAEGVRIIRRFILPTGFSVAIMGPDGAGKSTVIRGMREALLPAFRQTRQLHFRPKTFEAKGDDTPHTNPQGAVPRPAPFAFAKVLYYYLDHLVGHYLKVRPLKCRSTLVVFDRCFDDLVIDPRRFRLRGFTRMARMLRKFLPKHDLVIALDASPEIVNARKQELTIGELRRQRGVLTALAKREANYVLIDGGREPEAVLASCYTAVIDAMAKRLNR